MIVYVEPNFILELAYLQEDHTSCERILELAQAKEIQLAMPAFCGVEARMNQALVARQRSDFREQLVRQVRQLGRSQPYASLQASTTSLTLALLESGEQEKQRLEAILARLLQMSNVIPTTAPVLANALRAEQALGLSPQDALVYASVLVDLDGMGDDAKCFINRNRKDFANPDIYAALAQHNCRLSTTFRGGLGYILGNIGLVS